MEITQQQIANAKKVLSDAGYFTDNLWHINDVLFHSDCPKSTYKLDAKRILRNALTNEWIVGEIFYSIGEQLRDEQNGK
jgi:hypothetical protein